MNASNSEQGSASHLTEAVKKVFIWRWYQEVGYRACNIWLYALYGMKKFAGVCRPFRLGKNRV